MTLKGLNIFDTKTNSFTLGTLDISDLTVGENEYAGMYALPGFVDVHTHGAQKCFFETGNTDDNIRMLDTYAENGTLYLMPTIGTRPFGEIKDAAAAIIEAAAATKDKNTAKIIGIHFECRYLCPAKAGAHSHDLLVCPNTAEADELIDMIREGEKKYGLKFCIHFTISPELDGGIEFIKHAKARGATVGIGHSDSDFTEAMSALKAGAVSFTHLFNCLRPIHHRNSSAVTAALVSDAYTEFICDGVHLLPEISQLIYKAKSPDKRVLITDSVGLGVNTGETFEFISGPAYSDGKVARLADGTITGSIISMADAVKNFVSFTNAEIEEAAMAAVTNPSNMVGFTNIQGFNNFVIIDKNADLKAVFINGKKIR